MKIEDIKPGMTVELPGRFVTNSYGARSAGRGTVERIDKNFVYVRVGTSDSSGFSSDLVQYTPDELKK